jgi:hypothetical protein
MAILTPDQIKMEECQKQISEILKRYGLTYQPYFTCVGGQMAQGINLVPDTTITAQDLDAAMGGIKGGPNGR